jgi:hypothetical protein
MIQGFQKGRMEPFHYKAKPYGKTVSVAVSPILEDGRFVGFVQSVIPQEQRNALG